MLKGKALKFGDTIGIVAPSGPSDAETIDIAKSNLEKLGFKVVMGNTCYKKYHYFSGNDDERALDINEMFSNKNINAIFCTRGGYGAIRILNKINYDMIRKNPKIFVGYSDITSIHTSINRFCHLITFHGPMLTSDMDDFKTFTKESLFKSIMNKEPVGSLINPDNIEIKCLVPGKAEGEITGGNLSLVCASIGTPYEIDTKGKILFLEDLNEEPYMIDRKLMQLLLSGKLSECSGIILGDYKNCEAKKHPDRSFTLSDVFNGIIKPLNKPTIYNFKSGHCSPKITVPLGAEAELDADNCSVLIKEAAVI